MSAPADLGGIARIMLDPISDAPSRRAVDANLAILVLMVTGFTAAPSAPAVDRSIARLIHDAGARALARGRELADLDAAKGEAFVWLLDAGSRRVEAAA